MTLSIIDKIIRFTKRVKSSIAFYPAVISISIVLFGICLNALDNSSFTEFLNKNFPVLIVQDINTSRTILGSLIGALISLMVFSFTMVMVVLSQSVVSFTPRLLPGLISDRKHQIVLGFYLGSIFHCIFTLLRMEPGDYDGYLPTIGVLFAIILGISCLALFIYFIHSISQSVQISKIIYNLYKKTHKEIKSIQNQANLKWVSEPDITWNPLQFDYIGYVRSYDLNALASINKNKDFEIKTAVPEGWFISLHTPSFYVSKKISEGEKELLKSLIVIDDEEWVSEHPNIGIKHIIEITLKAMSAAINDPATALTGLDYLTNLLKELKGLRRYNCFQSKNGGRVFINALSFEEMLQIIFASLRQYLRHDMVLMSRLLLLLHYLVEDENYYTDQLFVTAIEKEAAKVLVDVNRHVENESDREFIAKLYKQYGFTE